MSGAVKLYNTLRAKIGDECAQELVGFINGEIKSNVMDLRDVFLTKADKADLIRSMKDDKIDLIRSMKDDKIELIRAMKDDKIELIQAMKDDKIELIQAMKNDKIELIQVMKNDKIELLQVMRDNKIELIHLIEKKSRAAYTLNLVQFLAIIGALLAIISYIKVH